ncbi:MAG: PEP-CTERM sorting domain-containing protein, partial [Tepidisphaeraceae bacterium]
FNQSITGWDQGDFNYDGLVNATDFNELAANFNQGVSGAASAGDVAALDAFAVANGLSLPTSSVPEPASAVIMVVAGLGILARRRRSDLFLGAIHLRGSPVGSKPQGKSGRPED